MTGGDTKPKWHSTALVLDLASKQPKWESIEQPFQRRALTTACLDGKVFVIGGLTAEMETTREVKVYDPLKDAWTACPELPGPKSNGFTPASCVVGRRLYVSTADGKIHRLSEKGNGWEAAGELKQPRYVHRMVAASADLLIVVGGASKSGNVALTETVRLLPTQ